MWIDKKLFFCLVPGNEAFTNFHDKLIHMHGKYFPKVIIKKGYSYSKPWLSEALRNPVKMKKTLYNEYIFRTLSVKMKLITEMISITYLEQIIEKSWEATFQRSSYYTQR